MREKKNFAERTKALKSDETRKKYFLVYEGKDTERLYFEAVNELRGQIKIDPLIELVPAIRSYSEEGWSNPQKIVQRMADNVDEIKSGNISYETLLNWIMEYFEDQGYIKNNRPLAKNMWSTLLWICFDKMKVSLKQPVFDLKESCENIFKILELEKGLENRIHDVATILQYGISIYEEGWDKICFIVDRDRDSFTDNQYEYVIKQCKDRGYGLYVTNPCFEFWLLMHFDDIAEIDEKQLLENIKVTSKYRYAEHELRKRVPGYKKSKYDAKMLVGNIEQAIYNEKIFCEDVEKLKEKIGSNIGLLIREMQQN